MGGVCMVGACRLVAWGMRHGKIRRVDERTWSALERLERVVEEPKRDDVTVTSRAGRDASAQC